MNSELRNILEAMPEGIVLVDAESMDVTMGNREFLRIFKSSLYDENGTNPLDHRNSRFNSDEEINDDSE